MNTEAPHALGMHKSGDPKRPVGPTRAIIELTQAFLETAGLCKTKSGPALSHPQASGYDRSSNHVLQP